MPTPVDPSLPAANASETHASTQRANTDAANATRGDVGAARSAQAPIGLEAAARAPTADTSAAPTPASSTPELPMAAQPPASPAEVQGFLSLMGDHADYAAYAIIQQGQAKSLALAATMRRRAQASASAASLQSITDMRRQIQGERKSAVYQLAGPILGAGTTLVTAPFDRTGVLGNVMSNVVSGGVNAVDKTFSFGGENQAQQARLAMRHDDDVKARAQQIADEARSRYDQAKESFTGALQAFAEHFRRVESLSSNVANM